MTWPRTIVRNRDSTANIKGSNLCLVDCTATRKAGVLVVVRMEDCGGGLTARSDPEFVVHSQRISQFRSPKNTTKANQRYESHIGIAKMGTTPCPYAPLLLSSETVWSLGVYNGWFVPQPFKYSSTISWLTAYRLRRVKEPASCNFLGVPQRSNSSSTFGGWFIKSHWHGDLFQIYQRCMRSTHKKFTEDTVSRDKSRSFFSHVRKSRESLRMVHLSYGEGKCIKIKLLSNQIRKHIGLEDIVSLEERNNDILSLTTDVRDVCNIWAACDISGAWPMESGYLLSQTWIIIYTHW